METNKVFAKVPNPKPSNTWVFQLPAIDLNGVLFYGWKMIYFKNIPTGKKDKQGKPEYKPVADDSKQVVYDSTTRQLKNQNLTNTDLASLMLNMANIKKSNINMAKTVASIMLSMAELKQQFMKGDK